LIEVGKAPQQVNSLTSLKVASLKEKTEATTLPGLMLTAGVASVQGEERPRQQYKRFCKLQLPATGPGGAGGPWFPGSCFPFGMCEKGPQLLV